MLLATLAATSMPLTGCAIFIPDVHDLRLLDVRPVEQGAANIEAWGEPAHDRPVNYVIGRIDLVTQSDVVGIVDASGLTFWTELTICETGATVPAYGVFYKGVELFDVGINEEIRARYLERAGQHNPAEPFTYQVYFDPRSTRSQVKAPGLGQPDLYEPFDFTREPRDLCLRIGGGNMMGGYFKSNTIVVPKAALKNAFDSAPD